MLTILLPSHEIIITSSDTQTIESFTCSQSFCPRSHEITITSSDTHTIESFTCMLTIFFPSHEITCMQTYIATFSSFSQSFCPSFSGLHNLAPEPLDLFS